MRDARLIIYGAGDLIDDDEGISGRENSPRSGLRRRASATMNSALASTRRSLDMRAGELCQREVVIAEGAEPVTAAAALMRHHHVGDIVVVRREAHGNVPVGVLTDRDLVVEVLAQAIDEVHRLTIGDVVARDLECVGEDCEFDEVLRLMHDRGIRRVPVVSPAGALVGIITFDDIVGVFAEQLAALSAVVRLQTRREVRARP